MSKHKLRKFTKIMMIPLAMTTTIGVTTSIVSCGHSSSPNPPIKNSWAVFKAAAKKATASQIIAASKLPDWAKSSSTDLSVTKLSVDEINKTLTANITNSKPYSTATFSIKYDFDKYNSDQWKYNSDINFLFSKNTFTLPDGEFTSVISIANSNMIYIITDAGLYQTTDNGKNITVVTSISTDLIISMVKKIDNTIYVGTSEGLYQSSDGKTFTVVSSIPSAANIYDVTKINNTIYVGSDVGTTGSKADGLYISTDGGKTFALNTTITNSVGVDLITSIDNVIYIGSDHGIFTSSDDGKTFVANDSFPKDQEVSLIQKIDNTIYVGCDDGLFQSSDGKTFSIITSIPKDNLILQIMKIDQDIYAGSDDGLFVSSDDGKTFVKNTQVPSDDNGVNNMYAVNGVIYIATDNGLYQSSDSGKTFAINSNIDKDSSVNQVSKLNGIIFVVTDDAIYENIKL